jgi:thiosulfate dehydrogenase
MLKMLTCHKVLAALLVVGLSLAGCAPTPERPLPADTAISAPGGAEAPMKPPPETAQDASEAALQSLLPMPLSLPADLPDGDEGKEIREGWAIFDDTPAALSAGAALRGDYYDGNALSCRNCHLDHGTRSGAFPLVNFSDEKRYCPRQGLATDGAQRINACLQRSLNASPLPAGDPEMNSLIAYLKWLSEQDYTKAQEGLSLRDFPDRAADFVTGEAVFYSNCAFCHGDGAEPGAPPLWGAQSYGTGSDLHRLLIATHFVKANMPPQGPILSLEEAYDVAAFINSMERVHPGGLERDYPALSTKPVDSPYPPYPDSFTQEQHQFGPFGPIIQKRELHRQADRWVYWVEHGTLADQRGMLTIFETE